MKPGREIGSNPDADCALAAPLPLKWVLAPMVAALLSEQRFLAMK